MSINDIQNNQTYFICLSKVGKAFQSKYLGCVKESYGPDFYFEYLERKGFKGNISCFGINEIGVGITKDEAKENYGKLKIDLPQVHFQNKKEIPEMENWPLSITK